jgi:hypothetical protein
LKFSINKSEFLNALNVVAKGASSRSTLPVLAGVKITARSASLVLETTDLDRSIRCVVAALVEDEGMCVIPQKLLSDIVNGTTQVTEGISAGMGIDIKSLILGALGGEMAADPAPVVVVPSSAQPAAEVSSENDDPVPV